MDSSLPEGGIKLLPLQGDLQEYLTKLIDINLAPGLVSALLDPHDHCVRLSFSSSDSPKGRTKAQMEIPNS